MEDSDHWEIANVIWSISNFAPGITGQNQKAPTVDEYARGQLNARGKLNTSAVRRERTFKARRLQLISAVSAMVCRSLLLTSVPRSLPARSTRENFPCNLSSQRRMICSTAWEREDLELAKVCPDVLQQRWCTQKRTLTTDVEVPD